MENDPLRVGLLSVRSFLTFFTGKALSYCLVVFIAVSATQKVSAQETLIIDLNVFGLNTNQVTAAQQVEEACQIVEGQTSAAALDQQAICNNIETLDQNDPDQVEQLQVILDTIGPEEAFSMNDSIVYVSDYQTTNVYARINTLRSVQPIGIVPSAFLPASPLASDHNHDVLSSLSEAIVPGDSLVTGSSPIDRLESGAGAAAGDLFSRFGVFLSGQISSGNIDGVTFEQDTDFSTNSVTGGIDYRFGDKIVAGVGLGVLQNDTEFTTVDGSTTLDGVNMTLFGSWYEADKGYLDVVLDAGSNSYELERGIGTDPAIRVLAQGETDASVLSLTTSVGRNFRVSSWDVGAYLRLSFTQSSVDAYTETASNDGPGFSSIFSIASQSIKSNKITIGGEASRAISTSKAVLVPALRLEYETERVRDKDNLEATLILTGQTRPYVGTDRDGGYTNLGIGGSAVFRNGKSAYAFYETHIQHDFVTQHWLKAGFRLEF